MEISDSEEETPLQVSPPKLAAAFKRLSPAAQHRLGPILRQKYDFHPGLTDHLTSSFKPSTRARFRKRKFSSQHPYLADKIVYLDLMDLNHLNDLYDEQDLVAVLRLLNQKYLRRKERYPKEWKYKAKNFFALVGPHLPPELAGPDSESDEEPQAEGGETQAEEPGQTEEPEGPGEPGEEDFAYEAETERATRQTAEDASDYDYAELQPHHPRSHRIILSDSDSDSDNDSANDSASNSDGSTSNNVIRVGGRYIKQRNMFRGVLPESAKRLIQAAPKQRTKQPIISRRGLAVKKKKSEGRVYNDDLTKELYELLDLEPEELPQRQPLMYEFVRELSDSDSDVEVQEAPPTYRLRDESEINPDVVRSRKRKGSARVLGVKRMSGSRTPRHVHSTGTRTARATRTGPKTATAGPRTGARAARPAARPPARAKRAGPRPGRIDSFLQGGTGRGAPTKGDQSRAHEGAHEARTHGARTHGARTHGARAHEAHRAQDGRHEARGHEAGAQEGVNEARTQEARGQRAKGKGAGAGAGIRKYFTTTVEAEVQAEEPRVERRRAPRPQAPRTEVIPEDIPFKLGELTFTATLVNRAELEEQILRLLKRLARLYNQQAYIGGESWLFQSLQHWYRKTGELKNDDKKYLGVILETMKARRFEIPMELHRLVEWGHEIGVFSEKEVVDMMEYEWRDILKEEREYDEMEGLKYFWKSLAKAVEVNKEEALRIVMEQETDGSVVLMKLLEQGDSRFLCKCIDSMIVTNKVNEALVMKAYDITKNNRFFNFEGERESKLLNRISVEDIRGVNYFECFLKLVFYYVSVEGCSKRLVNKLLISGHFTMKEGREYRSGFINRLNLVSLLSLFRPVRKEYVEEMLMGKDVGIVLKFMRVYGPVEKVLVECINRLSGREREREREKGERRGELHDVLVDLRLCTVSTEVLLAVDMNLAPPLVPLFLEFADKCNDESLAERVGMLASRDLPQHVAERAIRLWIKLLVKGHSSSQILFQIFPYTPAAFRNTYFCYVLHELLVFSSLKDHELFIIENLIIQLLHFSQPYYCYLLTKHYYPVSSLNDLRLQRLTAIKKLLDRLKPLKPQVKINMLNNIISNVSEATILEHIQANFIEIINLSSFKLLIQKFNILPMSQLQVTFKTLDRIGKLKLLHSQVINSLKSSTPLSSFFIEDPPLVFNLVEYYVSAARDMPSYWSLVQHLLKFIYHYLCSFKVPVTAELVAFLSGLCRHKNNVPCVVLGLKMFLRVLTMASGYKDEAIIKHELNTLMLEFNSPPEYGLNFAEISGDRDELSFLGRSEAQDIRLDDWLVGVDVVVNYTPCDEILPV